MAPARDEGHGIRSFRNCCVSQSAGAGWGSACPSVSRPPGGVMLTRTGPIEQGQAYTRRWLVLGVMCLSLLLIVMDNTIVNVALPTLQRDLGASTSELQWVVDAYVLVFAGLLLTMGSLGDRFGRRGALAVGLSVMGVGSILSSLANSADQLIATRALMGVGAAMIIPATLSIITNVFT